MSKILINTVMILCLFANKTAIGQNENLIELESAFNKFRVHVEQKEYDQAFNMYLDSFLIYLPIGELKKQFTELDNENIRFSITNSKLIFVSESVTANGVSYSFLKYGSTVHYSFQQMASKDYIKRIKDHFSSSYGNNYSYSNSEKEISIYKEQELISIKDKDFKFIPYKEKLNQYMHLWIPRSIFNWLLIKREGLNMLKKDPKQE